MYMSDSNICSETQIHINIGGATLTKLLVFDLRSIFIQYDSKNFLALYTDTCMHVQSKEITVVSSLNNIYYY